MPFGLGAYPGQIPDDMKVPQEAATTRALVPDVTSTSCDGGSGTMTRPRWVSDLRSARSYRWRTFVAKR